MIQEIVFFLNTPHFLFITIAVALIIKACLLFVLVPQYFRSNTVGRSLLFLIGVILGSMTGELVWFIKLMRHLFFPAIPYGIIIFFLRIAWAFLIIQYLALGLFLESLTARYFSTNVWQKFLISMSSLLVTYYLYIAIFNKTLIDEQARLLALAATSSVSPFLEITIMRHTVLYILPLLFIPSLLRTIHKIHKHTLPKILNHQLSIIIKYLMLPYLLAELLIAVHFEFKSLKFYTYPIVGISAVLITYIVYYCIRRVMGMRFLNARDHVESKHTFNFIDDFKQILEQLSSATSEPELAQITASFFKDACGIAHKKTSLYLRTNSSHKDVEAFLKNDDADGASFTQKSKILMYDELAFSNFYQEDPTRTKIITFLENISADIFLPIYEKEHIIAYIIISANTRPHQLYSNVERDEMLVFANYLANIINLLQNRNLKALLCQQHELKQELYHRQQEIQQYKDSIRTFLKQNRSREIGLIFYKQRRFIFANQSAKEMIGISPNMQEGHPLTRALKAIAHAVEEYKSPQTTFAKDPQGAHLIISGVSNLEQNNVIITVCYPDVTDVIEKQLSALKDPSSWDYLLYLETTKYGHLVHQFMPSMTETFLNFKIDILKIALTTQATLIEAPHDDIQHTAELLHTISARDTLHVIKLQNQITHADIAIKLFGTTTPQPGTEHKPLLEKLNAQGTLFIQNIEYLDGETQQYLSEFIKYGLYRPYKGEQQYPNATRIICSTSNNLAHLAQEGFFNPVLLQELKKSIISLPSLLTLPEQEIITLAEGFAEQALHLNDFKNLFELTEKDKNRIILARPASLMELKIKVQQILAHKSKKNNLETEEHIDSELVTTDPELIAASRLGKHALRDHKMMLLLWNKFKNQNKIAAFLGVNRSSVNRRCKEYNLQ